MIEKFTEVYYFWSTVGYYLTWNMQKKNGNLNVKYQLAFFHLDYLYNFYILGVMQENKLFQNEFFIEQI